MRGLTLAGRRATTGYMSDDQKTGLPEPRPQRPADRRAERVAAALRDNLRRRKEQARARAEAAHPDSETTQSSNNGDSAR